jgi:L-ascorbate metabolism protein UlaG (beta-lactamase superfamily)
MIIHYREHSILLDPCLNPKGTLPPYTLFRKKPRLNPIVDLPPDSEAALSQITSGLITHCRGGHFDHLDTSGRRLLAKKQVPVYCNALDEMYLKKNNIHTIPLTTNRKSNFLEGSITAFPAVHGYGLIGKFMGAGTGYFIELPREKTLYISGDTILNQTVYNVLTNLRPDIAVFNAGTATLDFGKPILMPMSELLDFIRMAPGVVLAAHLDAFNHCLTTRAMLKDAVAKAGLSGKVIIPADGELMEF